MTAIKIDLIYYTSTMYNRNVQIICVTTKYLNRLQVNIIILTLLSEIIVSIWLCEFIILTYN